MLVPTFAVPIPGHEASEYLMSKTATCDMVVPQVPLLVIAQTRVERYMGTVCVVGVEEIDRGVVGEHAVVSVIERYGCEFA